jgi:2-oxoacid:acceptor oxidoreductase gamma subunit (pyruvate/2-ketoisovalerate family)
MIELRFHGRGGQGTVVATKALADAIMLDGKWVQTFPEYGVERRGAPVCAYTRIDESRIYLRCKIYEPDHVVVMDPTLIEAVDVTAGMKPGGWILINSAKPASAYKVPDRFKAVTFDATSLALKYGLGSKAAPIVNMPVLGAFAKLTGFVSLDSLIEAVHMESPIKKDENVAATREAYESAPSGKEAA